MNEPPNDLNAERAVLGSCLLDNQAAYLALEKLTADDFYSSANRRIFEALKSLMQDAGKVDLVTIREALKGDIEKIGGEDYLGEVADSVPSSANIEQYAEIVRNKSILRQIIALTTKAREAALGNYKSEKILARLTSALFRVAERGGGRVLKACDVVSEILRKRESRVPALSTGFWGWDEATGGLAEGDYIIIAARPSIGKTALTLAVLEHLAEAGVPSLLFSVEMDRQTLFEQVAASKAGLNHFQFRRHFTEDEEGRFYEQLGIMGNWPIYVDNDFDLTGFKFRLRARQAVMQYGVKAIFVDYLQLVNVDDPKGKSGNERAQEISRNLKAAARELRVPVVCTCQLNRMSEHREGDFFRPRSSELRDSGSIEQDADVILLLHRPEHHLTAHKKAVPSEWVNKMEAIIAKQRRGPIGSFYLYFDKNTVSFRDWTDTDDLAARGVE